jgi:PIN domain nuclease of toxin-antitoxin system
VKLLLDTRVMLWLLARPEEIEASARKSVQDPENLAFASAVSAWEIEIKRALGKIRAPDDLAEQLRRSRITELPLRLHHVRVLRDLPNIHRDPFDRMLVAQAKADGLTLVTRDRRLRGYGVSVISA